MTSKSFFFSLSVSVFMAACAATTKEAVKKQEPAKQEAVAPAPAAAQPAAVEVKAAETPAPAAPVAPALIKVKFNYKDSKASRVAIAGEFNGWNPEKDWLAKTGDAWTIELTLPKGKNAYKLIVDGNWMTDPENPETIDDGQGGKNSVMDVK